MAAKPETRKPESKKKKPGTSWQREPIAKAPAAPRARGPRSPLGRAPAPPELASELAKAPPADLAPAFETQGYGVAYPCFPDLAAGALDGMRVYRTTAKPGTQGLQYLQMALPWHPALSSWDDIARCCGGGSYVVLGLAAGKVVKRYSRDLGGPSKTPTVEDVASLTPGLGINAQGQPAYETPNGWLTIPGLDPGSQVAFLTFQQCAHYARDDAHKAISTMAVLSTQLAEKAMQPDPGLAVLQTMVEAQRLTIQQLYNDMNELRKDNVKLKIENNNTNSEESKVKVEAMRKALDMIDGAMGTVALKMLNAQTPAAAGDAVQNANKAIGKATTATDLGAAIAARALAMAGQK